MAKKKELDENIKELKSKLLENKVILGTERVLKFLKAGKLKRILLASNCPIKVKEDIGYYAKLAKVDVISLEQSNEEVGIICKKNFFVSVIGITE